MTSFISDDLSLEVERHLRTAVEVCIAAAFVNFQGVELLKKFIAKSKPAQAYTINFLLDQDFHPHPAARDAIIRELCSVPGARVRVFSDEERRLHMKVYIFSAGNSVSVIAGSHNPTGAGLAKNIEAGLLTSDKKAVNEARRYFNHYWSKAKVVVPDPNAFYCDPSFQPGQQVRLKGTKDYGIIAMTPAPVLREKTWYYYVLWATRGVVTPSLHREQELQAMTVIETAPVQELVERLGERLNSGDVYLRSLLSRKLLTPVRNGLFAYMASRTDVIPYQFKPLLKLLNGTSYRILIADEVGLGKTIEAGIIFTELKARLSKMNRTLIVSPTNLKTKWKDEMESRFDEYFHILDRARFEQALKHPEESCFGIVSYELLGRDEMIDLLKQADASWDMVIMDEAHHLRNKNKRHLAAAQLTRRATALVMLSATPVNLGIADLTRLLQLLLPSDYRDVNEVEFAHRVEPNRYLFRAVELADQDPKGALVTLQEMERRCKHADRVASEPAYQRVIELLSTKELLSAADVAQVQDELTSVNTLASVISRTRKEDVGAGKPREVVTQSVEFTPNERKLYNAITRLARSMASEGKKKGAKRNSLAVLMPQRQAASCLPAALIYLNTMVATRTLDVTELVGEIDEDSSDEADSVTVTSQTVINEARAILQAFRNEDIETTDTKYNALCTFLRTRAVSGGNLDKVIIFTSFRKTLEYLKRRLDDDFGPGTTIEIHGDIQPLTERDARRAQFQSANGPSVLLCTEVGSEGLDMQFANKLVNYDLPWNPMRVEQRIGRIDRYGQLAEKLLILNFAMSETVEDNVVARLVERIKVFRDSLGPLNQVIGETVRQLQDDLLNPNLTENERLERMRRHEVAIETKARAEEKFQESRKQLLGQDKNFTEEISGIHQNRQYITPGELVKVVELFCLGFSSEATLRTVESGIYRLEVSGGARKVLVDSVRSQATLNEEKRTKYLGNLATGVFQFTTDRAVAVQRKDIEFFTILHPVIAGIVTSWRVPSREVYAMFSGKIDHVAAGNYLLFTYYCEYDRNLLPPAVYVYNLAVDMVSGLQSNVGDVLYHGILEGELQPASGQVTISPALAHRANQSIHGELTRVIHQTEEELQRDRETLIHQQAQAIQTASEKEIAALSRRRLAASDSRQRNEISKQIEEKRGELTRRLEDLTQDPGDVVARSHLVGVAWCQVVKREGEA